MHKFREEKKFKKIIRAASLIILLANGIVCYAQSPDSTQVTAVQGVPQDTSSDAPVVTKPNTQAATAAKAQDKKNLQALNESPVVERAAKEDKILQNPFSIAFYKPTYVLPYYYTGSPDNSVYQGETPEGESLKKSEVKYQLSFKVPLWQRMFNLPTTLFFAYSQLSYWQLYDRDPFFRETDYEPEAFLANEVNFHLFGNWNLNFINLGAVHQSNGYGGTLERSWNRIYLAATASSENWVISIRPWYVFHDSTYERQNPNMANFLGHEQIIVAFKYYNQVLSLEARNVIENHARHAALTASWSFPITKHLNGYIQGFTGYGQSLIEYNHRTNSVGVGIALSNWV